MKQANNRLSSTKLSSTKISSRPLFGMLSALFIALPAFAFGYGLNTNPDPRTGTGNYQGNDFWVAFPENAASEVGSVLSLSVVVVGDPGTKVEIGGSNYGVSTILIIPSDRFIKYEADTSLQMVGKEVHAMNALHVIADHKVSVYVFDHRQKSTDSYAATPTNELGSDYVVAGYDKLLAADHDFSTQCTVIATEDSTTISFVAPQAQSDMPNPAVLTEVLRRGEVFQLRSSAAPAGWNASDITGVLLHASKRVAFLTGQRCAQVPSDVSFCNLLVEQEPSIDNFGTRYVAVKLLPKPQFSLRVIATQNSTEVRIAGVHQAWLDRGGEYTVDSMNRSTLITTSKPALVEEFGQSGQSGDTDMGDPFMFLLTPDQSFAQNAELLVKTLVDYSLPTDGDESEAHESDAHEVVEEQTIDDKVNRALEARELQARIAQHDSVRTFHVMKAPPSTASHITAPREITFVHQPVIHVHNVPVANAPTSKWSHYISVVLPESALGSLRVNGVEMNGASMKPIVTEAIAGSPNIVAHFKLSEGEYRITDAAPIAVYQYGFGDDVHSYDAYGHACGRILKAIP